MEAATQHHPEEGALARKLDEIQDVAGVQGREIAQLLGTTPQTVSRWRNGKAEPQNRSLNRLLTLAWLAGELGEFYRPDEARLWLFSPHRLLGGQRPADRIEEDRADDVLALIAQLRDGSYA
jgi:transcriptional regulator with XRE-family HTH domain